jgi:hypothetical protein
LFDDEKTQAPFTKSYPVKQAVQAPEASEA